MPTCDYEGCERPSRYRRGGLCEAHGKQRSLGKALRPLLERVPRAGACLFDPCERARLARGYCSAHYQQIMRGQTLAPVAVTSECTVVWCDRVAKGSKSGMCKRHTQTFGKYRATAAWVNQKFADQDERCAICLTTESGRLDWCIDHDHSCCASRVRTCGRCLRGIVCSGCNLMLGHAKDNAARLRAGADYLEMYDFGENVTQMRREA